MISERETEFTFDCCEKVDDKDISNEEATRSKERIKNNENPNHTQRESTSI